MGPEGEDFFSEATPAPQVKDGDILSTNVEAHINAAAYPRGVR